MPVYIELTKGKKCIVDNENADLMEYNWYINSDNNGYAARSQRTPDGRIKIYMHRVIMERELGRSLRKGEYVYHINRNKLDNRSSNLRISTNSQNNANKGKRSDNTSGYKGVVWHKQANKWMAKIKVDGKQIYLGLFDDISDAVDAYDSAAVEYFGDFAHTNR